MEAHAPRGRFQIAMLMVVIGFLAISMAGVVASARDRDRPDFMTALFAFYACLGAASGFYRNSGRALAGTWGESLAALAVYLAGETWFGLVFTPLPPDSSVLHLMIWNYWPPLAATFAGILGGFLARRRFDRLHEGLEG